MKNLNLSIIQIAEAHEEGATSITPDNTLGPLLALAIIILAIVAAKRIKKIKKHYDPFDLAQGHGE